jgi:hypothetical protein
MEPHDSLRPLVSLSPGRAPQFDGHAVFVSRVATSIVDFLERHPALPRPETWNWHEEVKARDFVQWWNERDSQLRDQDDLDALRAFVSLEPKNVVFENERLVHRQLVGQTVVPRYPATEHILQGRAVATASSRTVEECLNALEGYWFLRLQSEPTSASAPRANPKRAVFGGTPWEAVLSALLRSDPTLFNRGQITRWFDLVRFVAGTQHSPGHSVELEVVAFVCGCATDDDLRSLLRDPDCYDGVMTLLAEQSHRAVPGLGDPELIKRGRELASETAIEVLAIERWRFAMPSAMNPLALKVQHGDVSLLMSLLAESGALPFTERRGWNPCPKSVKNKTFATIIRNTNVDEVTVPDFRAAVRAHRVKDEVLVALALAIPEWTHHVVETLDWDGLEEAIWFVQAHVDLGCNRDPVPEVQSRTVLSVSEREAGVVDVAWFTNAYERLGPKRWKYIEKWAKVAHFEVRCTCFTQAIRALTGSLTEEHLKQEVEAKRSKTAIKNLGLCALSDDAAVRESQLVQRYLFIREFERGSSAFGSTRRASEASAVRVAIENLAQRAGYDDSVRLLWMIESVQDKDSAVSHGEVDAKQRAYRLKQIRRSLQDMMIAGSRIPAAELEQLLGNPVLGPELVSMIWVDDGQSTVRRSGTTWTDVEGRPVEVQGSLRVAHPFDLLRFGSWADWQEVVVADDQRQSIRQVFREVYVPTENEVGKKGSERYIAHLVKPAQAFALLSAAGWHVGGEEDGCTRTFHRDGVVAYIAPETDYYSPRRAQPFSIGEVRFSLIADQSTLSIEAVPALVFSETMRDLDLVVSVAFAGGAALDSTPSTLEMRKTVVERFVQSRGLAGVAIQGQHVHIRGSLNEYEVHLGSGEASFRRGGGALVLVPVHIFTGDVHLPYCDDDLRTAEIISKVLMLAEDFSIRDPAIAEQLRRLE